jgi:hypothetical protein
MEAVMKRLALSAVLLITFGAAGASSQSPPEAPAAWGRSVEGLRIGILGPRTVTSARTEFIIGLQNTGSSDFIVSLGHMLGNGKVMSPTALRFTLTDTAGKNPRELHFMVFGISGRMDDFIVALRRGAMYTMPTSLQEYGSETTKEFRMTLMPGRYRILARFEGKGATYVNLDMPGVALLNFWKGTVQSSAFEFEVTD